MTGPVVVHIFSFWFSAGYIQPGIFPVIFKITMKKKSRTVNHEWSSGLERQKDNALYPARRAEAKLSPCASDGDNHQIYWKVIPSSTFKKDCSRWRLHVISHLASQWMKWYTFQSTLPMGESPFKGGTLGQKSSGCPGISRAARTSIWAIRGLQCSLSAQAQAWAGMKSSVLSAVVKTVSHGFCNSSDPKPCLIKPPAASPGESDD